MVKSFSSIVEVKFYANISWWVIFINISPLINESNRLK